MTAKTVATRRTHCCLAALLPCHLFRVRVEMRCSSSTTQTSGAPSDRAEIVCFVCLFFCRPFFCCIGCVNPALLRVRARIYPGTLSRSFLVFSLTLLDSVCGRWLLFNSGGWERPTCFGGAPVLSGLEARAKKRGGGRTFRLLGVDASYGAEGVWGGSATIRSSLCCSYDARVTEPMRCVDVPYGRSSSRIFVGVKGKSGSSGAITGSLEI
ncbi:unnamed protein product [Ectocarpus sp. 8 AP-2014]